MTPEEEAGDPNTAPARLASLVEHYPRTVLRNPVLPLIFLVEPTWPGTALPFWSWLTTLQKGLLEPDLPPATLECLSYHNHPVIRSLVQLHVGLGEAQPGWEQDVPAALAALLDNSYFCSPVERELLVKNVLLPPTLAALVPETTTTVAPPPEPPERQWDEPKNTQYPAARLRRARNEGTPAPVLELLAEDEDPEVTQALLQNRSTPTKVLDQIFKRLQHDKVRNKDLAREALYHRHLTLEQAGYLKTHFGLRGTLTRLWELTQNPHEALPEDVDRVLRQLTQEQRKCLEALLSPSYPGWLRAKALLARYSDCEHRVPFFCGLLLSDHLQGREALVGSPFWFLRFAVAIHRSSTPEQWQALASDANKFVRAAARARLAEPGWTFPWG